MPEPRAHYIRRVRRQMLDSLKLTYPAAMQADGLYLAMIGVFPDLTWSDFAKDLAYLAEKGFMRRVIDRLEEGEEAHIRPRARWYVLTGSGVEIADRLVKDPALEV